MQSHCSQSFIMRMKLILLIYIYIYIYTNTDDELLQISRGNCQTIILMTQRLGCMFLLNKYIHMYMCVYFWSKVNFWNVNCARATIFIFDTWTDVLVKSQNFCDRKCLDLRGTRTPNFRIHAECSNYLGYQGQTFAVPCFWILPLGV